MTTRLFVLIAVSIVLTACGGSQTDPEAVADTARPASASTGSEIPDDETIIRHMHKHAAQLAKLYDALKAEDLEAAGTPAYWLSRHEEYPGLPDDWAPYLSEMRAQAEVIEGATNLDTARQAADKLTEACQGCHSANKVDVVFPTE